ncbi:MAG: hypothetical protein K6G33_09865 [Ruminococcus sp.]|uniref:dockerin type I repeat-containing protein n=1 Tax=Ruminococcus sp. TaxID=41978 RepID=UPI0025D11EDD|nr:dockerin type I domain-containing protein [Ruminococcus sp.]MCR5601029.1 hypothetical protein [Ruminococcus sp.]
MTKSNKIIAFVSSLAVMASVSVLPASAAAAQKTYKLGDVDLNGTIDLKDLTEMKKGVFWLSNLSDAQKKAADINQDGHVNLSDLALLKAHLGGLYKISGEVKVNYDENGNAAEYINDNEQLSVSSDAYLAEISNAANGSALSLSNHYLSYTSANGDSSAVINPWYSELKYNNADSSLAFSSNEYNTSAKTVYAESGKSVGISLSKWGTINAVHDSMAEVTSPFMKKTYDFFNWTNKSSEVFTQTGYGMDETVNLVNAEVTKRDGGIEFVNHVSTDTVYSFMADDYVTIDDVKISYSDGEFTIEGIADEDIDFIHTMTVGQYDEIAVVTNTPGNRLVYGLMYDKDSASMAALVKVKLDQDAEATVIQYSKPNDMATTINFYPKEGVVDRAMANRDEIVTLFDTQYDPNGLVFQTVHFPRKTKNMLAGTLNARYQITNGITYKQTAGNASIKLSYASTASTLTFNSADDTFSLVNNEGKATVGITSAADSVKYNLGTESLSVAGKTYSPNSAVTYTFGDSSETFTPAGVLAQHVPFMY